MIPIGLKGNYLSGFSFFFFFKSGYNVNVSCLYILKIQKVISQTNCFEIVQLIQIPLL